MPRGVKLGLGLGLALGVAGCGETRDLDGQRPPAPLAVRGAVVVEPPRLALGETAIVEVAVVTPPGHRVRPVEAPDGVPGLWILAAETLPVERSPQRWLHRTRFSVRARETGRFEWPGPPVVVEKPSGGEIELSLEPRPLEVAELQRELPSRRDPFGLRLPPMATTNPGLLAPALAGALAALAGVGLVALVRRARQRTPQSPTVSAASPTATAAPEANEAHEGLDAAVRVLASDPVPAAEAAARALRRLLAARFGVATAATTEELCAREPPQGLKPHWEPLLAALRELDAVRFRRPGPDACRAAEHALGSARQWLERAAPRSDG